MTARTPQIRLLPVTIFVAALMLSVRVNDIWKGVSHIAPPAVSQLQAQQPPAPGSRPQPEAPKEEPLPVPPPEQGAGDDALDQIDFSQAELDVLQRLSERREGLEARGRELDMREGLLKAAEARIDTKVAELKALQTTLEGLLKQYDEQEETKMRSLVKIYENMKPKDAARIFERLDMPVLLEVIERMKEQKIAPIMAEMDPGKAKLVTSELAGRRQIPEPGTATGG